MDFSAVVHRATQLHVHGIEGTPGQPLVEEVYGRICSSRDDGPPDSLATSPGRRTVFVFGSDAIASIVLRQNPYDALLSVGFDRPYIYHEVVDLGNTYWLVLFKPTACERDDFLVTPATWDGVVQVVRTCYPEAHMDLMEHLQELKTRDFEHFEAQAGFEFLDARKNENGSIPNGRPFYSYSYFCGLPRPREAWHVRLFLYCEMRLLRLFQGGGYTLSEKGDHGSLEYFCTNVPLSTLDPKESAVIPMKVTIPAE